MTPSSRLINAGGRFTLPEIALNIALVAHDGQRDRSGDPVVMHPIAVANLGKTDDEKAVGYLHDVAEDTGWTFDDMAACGIPPRIIEALRLLTHDKDTPYLEYVAKVRDSGNRLAIAVKRNDLTVNLERGRRYGYDKLVEKHSAGLAVLDGIQ